MMAPSPAAPCKMPETDRLLEFLVIPLDAPSELGDIDQAGACDVVGEGRQPILGWLLFSLGPFEQQPCLGAWIRGAKSLAMGGAHANRCETRGEPLACACPPLHYPPGLSGQRKRQFLGRQRLSPPFGPHLRLRQNAGNIRSPSSVRLVRSPVSLP